MPETEIDWQALAAPFEAKDLEWRAQAEGGGGDNYWVRCVCYITNRAIQIRLDQVCGPGGWCNEYRQGPGGQAGSVICGISIRVNGEWVTKWDGADSSDIEAVKGGLSDAMKRAAVQWGIGRYLYKLPAGWGIIGTDKKVTGAKPCKDKVHYWLPPQVPAWALPPVGPPKASPREAALQKENEDLKKALRISERNAGPPTMRLLDALNLELGRLGLGGLVPGSITTYKQALESLNDLTARATPGTEEPTVPSQPGSQTRLEAAGAPA